MGKEGLTIYQAHEKRISFIEKAVGEGALAKISTSERSQNIALVYYLNEEISQKRVGEISLKPSGEPLTRQAVNQISKRFLKELRKHVSPQLRAKNPLCELLMRRPTALGETASRVKNAVENGINPQNIGLSPLEITKTRETLRKRGIEVPPQTAYADFAARVKIENDDRVLQKILDGHSDGFIRGYMNWHRNRKDKEKVLSSLSAIIISAGFHPHFKLLSLFAKTIEEASIPIKKLQIEIRGKQMEKLTQTYWIVLAKHRQRIVERLENDPNLQKFKKIPTYP